MVTFNEILAVANGAEFYNVDLHIHSYGASEEVKDKTMTPEAIVDAAVTQELRIIAITDHNSDRNVAAALERAKRHTGEVLVLPGAEITCANGHLLAYFSPENAAALNDFLGRLDLVGERGARNTHTKRSMADVIAEAFNAGGVCIAAHIDRQHTGFETLDQGYPNWKRDILTSAGLYGVECDAKEHLAWYSETDEPTDAGAERRKLFQARAGSEHLKGRRHLAHVQGSDAHDMAQFANLNPDKPWTRMKLMELTFAGFRTAMTDPTARVRAKAAIPRAIPRVRGIAVNGGFLNGQVIRFSDNLNCFIGGRGTGKSTAIRSLAYSFGINDEFGEFENCPDSVVVFCEDANGVVYRYERSKGGDITVTANIDGKTTEAPVDAFRIEYFGQGALAGVAKDPLNNPQLLQEFLDRHINLRDLIDAEASLVHQLRENAARLTPLETSFGQLSGKRDTLESIEKKLKIAEEGKLREIAGTQSRIAAEKTIRGVIEDVAEAYNNGLDLSVLERDFDEFQRTAGEVTADEKSIALLKSIRETLEVTNRALKAKASEINQLLKKQGEKLVGYCSALKSNHSRLDSENADKIAALKAKGLAGSISELQQLLRQKEAVGGDIATIKQRNPERTQCRSERERLLATLRKTRSDMTARRKAQLASINQNLKQTIGDYTVFVQYDPAGIIHEFLAFILEKMQGSYLQEQTARQLCDRVTPGDLADWILARDFKSIATAAGVDEKWAQELIHRLSYWNILFDLQVLAKQPKPAITVRAKSTPPRQIPVVQLSDGQRHTILLTIAMLAESNVPLVIDQPEDELDNAFIFSSIVANLRAIKECRQVILVTHNANIAVLGDSELLLPMRRENECGIAVERGSIDRGETKRLAESILEGGPEAFCRRREIYGH